jgi:hypothetical protein
MSTVLPLLQRTAQKAPLFLRLILTHILQNDRIKDEHVRRRGVISLVAGVQPTDDNVVKAVPYLVRH